MLRKKIFRAVPLCLILVLAAALFTACGADAKLNKAAKAVNNYKITCEYDGNLKTVAGVCELSYINNTEVPLNELKLHLYGNAYRENAKFSPIPADKKAEAYPNGPSYGDIKVSNVKLNGKDAAAALGGQDSDILTIPFDKPLYPTARYKISMDFKLVLANVLHRLGYGPKAVNLGNWYPIACVYEKGAYSADPYYSSGDCFYSDISNYEVVFTAPKAMITAATGETQKVEAEGEKCRYTFKAKAVRDFALVLSDKFQTVSAKAGKTAVTYYYYDDDAPDAALKASVDAVETFNDMFGLYPYGTLAVVKTGFLHSGMEYPNLVYISDSDKIDSDYFAEVIIHEVAHQWWYGIIGNDEVRDAWMDEGLADYSTTLFYEKNKDYKKTRSDRIMEAMKQYLLFTDLKSFFQGDKPVDTSMNRALNEYNSEYEYVSMTYIKGQLLFDNLRNTIGDKSFFDGLRQYYSRNMFKNVKQEHLIGAFESSSGKDLDGYFSAWIKGTVLIGDLY